MSDRGALYAGSTVPVDGSAVCKDEGPHPTPTKTLNRISSLAQREEDGAGAGGDHDQGQTPSSPASTGVPAATGGHPRTARCASSHDDGAQPVAALSYSTTVRPRPPSSTSSASHDPHQVDAVNPAMQGLFAGGHEKNLVVSRAYVKSVATTFASFVSQLTTLPDPETLMEKPARSVSDPGQQVSETDSEGQTQRGEDADGLNIATVSQDGGGDSLPANAIPFWHNLEAEGFPSGYFATLRDSLDPLKVQCDMDPAEEMHLVCQDLVTSCRLQEELGQVKPSIDAFNDTVQMYMSQCTRLLSKKEYWLSLKDVRDGFVHRGVDLVYALVEFLKDQEKEATDCSSRTTPNFGAKNSHNGYPPMSPLPSPTKSPSGRATKDYSDSEFEDDVVLNTPQKAPPDPLSSLATPPQLLRCGSPRFGDSTSSFERPEDTQLPQTPPGASSGKGSTASPSAVNFGESSTTSTSGSFFTPNHGKKCHVSGNLPKFLPIQSPGVIHHASDCATAAHHQAPTGSWLYPEKGIMLHCWVSTEAAELFTECWSHVWDTLMDHRLESIRAPFSVYYCLEGYAWTLTALPPVVDLEEPPICCPGELAGTLLNQQATQLLALCEAPYTQPTQSRRSERAALRAEPAASPSTERQRGSEASTRSGEDLLELHLAADGTFYLLQLEWFWEKGVAPLKVLPPLTESAVKVSRVLLHRKVMDSKFWRLSFNQYVELHVLPDFVERLLATIGARPQVDDLHRQVTEDLLPSLLASTGLPVECLGHVVQLLLKQGASTTTSKKRSSKKEKIGQSALGLCYTEMAKRTALAMLRLELTVGAGASAADTGDLEVTSATDTEEYSPIEGEESCVVPIGLGVTSAMRVTKTSAAETARRLHVVNRFFQEITRPSTSSKDGGCFWAGQLAPHAQHLFPMLTHYECKTNSPSSVATASNVPGIRLCDVAIGPVLAFVADNIGVECDPQTTRFFKFNQLGKVEASMFDLVFVADLAKSSLAGRPQLASEWRVMICPDSMATSTTAGGTGAPAAAGQGIPMEYTTLRQAYLLKLARRSILTRSCYRSMDSAWTEILCDCDSNRVGQHGAGAGRLSPFAVQFSGLMLEQCAALSKVESFALEHVMPALTQWTAESDASFVGNRFLQCASLLTTEFSVKHHDPFTGHVVGKAKGDDEENTNSLNYKLDRRPSGSSLPPFNATPYFMAFEAVLKIPWMDVTFCITLTQGLRELENRSSQLSIGQAKAYIEEVVRPISDYLEQGAGRAHHAAKYRMRVLSCFVHHPAVVAGGGEITLEAANKHPESPVLALAKTAYGIALKSERDRSAGDHPSQSSTMLLFFVAAIALRGRVHLTQTDPQERQTQRMATLCERVIQQCTERRALAAQLASDPKAVKLLDQCGYALSDLGDATSRNMIVSHLVHHTKQGPTIKATLWLQQVGRGFASRQCLSRLPPRCQEGEDEDEGVGVSTIPTQVDGLPEGAMSTPRDQTIGGVAKTDSPEAVVAPDHFKKQPCPTTSQSPPGGANGRGSMTFNAGGSPLAVSAVSVTGIQLNASLVHGREDLSSVNSSPHARREDDCSTDGTASPGATPAQPPRRVPATVVG